MNALLDYIDAWRRHDVDGVEISALAVRQSNRPPTTLPHLMRTDG
jgi:hypothetical protein